MNKTYLSRKIFARLSLRAAVRMICCILTLALWGPARAGAQAQPQPLDVASTSITAKLALTYKLKPNSSTDYAWFYKVGTNGSDTEFSGTLTGTNDDWQHGAIDIKSEKAIADADKDNPDSYPILKLDGLNLTYNADDSLFNMVQNGNPLCIQATGSSASTLRCQGVVINNDAGCDLLLDGGAAGLNILGKGYSNGIYLYTAGHSVDLILKGKINIVADNKYGVSIGNSASLSATEDARITASGGLKAILDNNVHSPFLEWRFEASLGSGKTLEIKDANGDSLDPAIRFTTDDKNKHFAISVAKSTGYTVWLGDEQLMDEKKRTVFTTTENGVSSFSKMQTLPAAANWPEYAQFANVGPEGTDIAVSGTNYTVKTSRGLAWIAWVTNNGKTKTTADTQEAYSSYYPASAGFKDCTVTLAGDISLAKPAQGVASDFEANWIPIGTYESFDAHYYFQGTFDGGGHTITGMTISSASFYYIGLFGYLYGATVRNLTMAESQNIHLTTANAQSSIYNLGSVAGSVENGKIINCHNQCEVSFSVTGKSGYVGGIAGYSYGSVISACSNRAAVTMNGNKSYAGGIVGYNTGSSIVSCFNTGNISATAAGTSDTSATHKGAAYAGGIGARSGTFACNILRCYSTGGITATSDGFACSGGIAGEIDHMTIESCFATGTVSAEANADMDLAAAGGIIGHNSGNNTIKNCLALTTEGVKASGTVPSKHAGRILGYDLSNVTLIDNYASTNIQLTVGTTVAAPTNNIGSDKLNGADTYLDDVAADIAAWAGPEDTKAFTAIGTDVTGKLPLLKAVANYDADGLPTAYESAVIPDQPTDLKVGSYLSYLLRLSLPSGDTETITLSCSNNKWSYKKGDGAETRFSGSIGMKSSSTTSTNKLIVATATGNPTLTLNDVKIRPTDGAALTVGEGCDLTIASSLFTILGSSGASTLINNGTLRLSGSGLRIENTSSSDTRYCLDNSGTFSVTDPSTTSVTLHCANTAIHNTGTLANAWMECRFTEGVGDAGATIKFDSPLSSIEVKRYDKTLATVVTAGKKYQIWANSSKPQKGLDSEGTAVFSFPAPEADGGVTTFTEVGDRTTVEISGNKNLSEAGLSQSVIVKSDGVLTVDTENASVIELELEEGAQVVTTNALKVSFDFRTTRSLDNKWMAFGSPIDLRAGLDQSGSSIYAATGYTAKEAVEQGWKEVPTTEGIAVGLTADSPYLLAAEAAGTKVTFNATASAGSPIKIPATATVALGDALANGVFLFRTNPNLANLTLRGIYVLNAEGTRFELQEADYVLKPFEAYITANAVTRSLVRSVGVADGSVVTANEIATATAAVRVWAADGALHVCTGEAAALTVVRSDGRTVYAASIAPGDTRLALPSGIYMIRINNITYKIAL
ncbi:GLUG motif-containing protein [Parabacteroides sp.]|uniref:GLUG motif-containing protein n=1 Tax=Parabacteroides sp. TaxID=1869337 RepID=UPI0026E0E093|nr:GLUG motif-containing protein [Parabacteroides sp.]MDO5428170.1 hypothetical protein [Parabacteroides sp.]